MGLLDDFSSFVPAYLSVPILISSIAAFYVLRALYAAITNPLSSIPGPEISRWTDLHLRFILLLGKRAQYVHSLHQKYGPVVRIAPNEVDVSDRDAAREIHRARGGFLKSSFYTTAGRVQSLFSTTDPTFHSNRRRLLGPCFTEASLSSLEPVILERVRLAVRKLGDESKTTGSADVLKWWTLLAMDIIGELSFGESFHLLEYGKKNQYATDIANAGSLFPLRTAFPTLIWIAGYLPLPFFKDVAHARQRIFAYNKERVARYMQLVGTNPDITKKTLFTSLLEDASSDLTEFDLTVEAQSYITAGTDTTGVTLTYLVYAVCQDKKIQDTLVRELQSVPEDLTHRDVRDLPYLNCVVEEALRRYGAAPGCLPRVVPSEGATLAGQHLRSGTIVSTQAYSVHRDPEAFPNPESFDPSRWEDPSKKMKDAFMAFGTGPRGCIGIHLARMELRLAAALFFRTFPDARISSKDGMSDSDMEEKISFLLMPKGHRCLVEVG